MIDTNTLRSLCDKLDADERTLIAVKGFPHEGDKHLLTVLVDVSKESSVTPYVVWTFNGAFVSLESGDYHGNLLEACASYVKSKGV